MPNFTKKAIMDSFLKLIAQKPLDKITVKDIVEDCGITRRTFYYHYQNIFSLVEELFKVEIERIVSDYPSAERWEEGFIYASQFIIENRQAVYHLYNSTHRDELEKYIEKIASEVMGHYISQMASGLSPAPKDVEMISSAYLYILTGFVKKWLDSGMKSEPGDVIRRLGYLFDDNIRRALERSSESRDK